MSDVGGDRCKALAAARHARLLHHQAWVHLSCRWLQVSCSWGRWRGAAGVLLLTGRGTAAPSEALFERPHLRLEIVLLLAAAAAVAPLQALKVQLQGGAANSGDSEDQGPGAQLRLRDAPTYSMLCCSLPMTHRPWDGSSKAQTQCYSRHLRALRLLRGAAPSLLGQPPLALPGLAWAPAPAWLLLAPAWLPLAPAWLPQRGAWALPLLQVLLPLVRAPQALPPLAGTRWGRACGSWLAWAARRAGGNGRSARDAMPVEVMQTSCQRSISRPLISGLLNLHTLVAAGAAAWPAAADGDEGLASLLDRGANFFCTMARGRRERCSRGRSIDGRRRAQLATQGRYSGQSSSMPWRPSPCESPRCFWGPGWPAPLLLLAMWAWLRQPARPAAWLARWWLPPPLRFAWRQAAACRGAPAARLPPLQTAPPNRCPCAACGGGRRSQAAPGEQAEA